MDDKNLPKFLKIDDDLFRVSRVNGSLIAEIFDKKEGKFCKMNSLTTVLLEGREISENKLPEKVKETIGLKQKDPILNKIKKVIKGAGQGALIAGGGIIYTSLGVLSLIFTAGIALAMIRFAIIQFMEGSILIGSLFLIGTPFAIALARIAFPLLLVIMIIAGVIWGVSQLAGFSVSFANAWDIVFFIVKILVLAFAAFIGIYVFIDAVRQKRVLKFFKECWWIILLFCFLFWLFFF